MQLLPILEPLPAAAPAAASPDTTGSAKGTYAFVSLGCPKNLVDSERMLGLLQIDGYQLVPEADGADFVVVNTCGFIDRARAESFGAIDEALELKRKGRTKGVIVSGCLAERQQELLLQERPEIDFLVGVFGREEITRVADRLVGNLREQRALFRPAPIRALDDTNRLRITPRHFAYLKISEGCDRLCTFCAIPRMRGKHASKPIEAIVQEAKQLSEDGVRELIIVAQDTTYYGIDLYGQPRLAELLRQLDQLPGIDWIRLMYFYPMYVNDELIQTLASARHIIPYLDMPLQHINDTMLKRMARRVNRHDTETLLAKLRQTIPALSLRTTFITGFPGETDAHFEELLEFVADQKFERMGVFTYSLEPDTPAAQLPDHVAPSMMESRRDRLMAVQRKISRQRNKRLIGQRRDVILDQAVPNEQNVWIGRTIGDAPDVDGVVFVTGDQWSLSTGRIVPCEIVANQEYDLVAVALSNGR
ncbi:MAG: 30S ribosomal protein S12 methylthiotransferase RimO [Planctomycetes bacterium]|nr:30S ribosomal protein S12 methylthiotransferase RimO [Planctomycetota bacterium]